MESEKLFAAVRLRGLSDPRPGLEAAVRSLEKLARDPANPVFVLDGITEATTPDEEAEAEGLEAPFGVFSREGVRDVVLVEREEEAGAAHAGGGRWGAVIYRITRREAARHGQFGRVDRYLEAREAEAALQVFAVSVARGAGGPTGPHSVWMVPLDDEGAPKGPIDLAAPRPADFRDMEAYWAVGETGRPGVRSLLFGLAAMGCHNVGVVPLRDEPSEDGPRFFGARLLAPDGGALRGRIAPARAGRWRFEPELTEDARAPD